MPRGLLAASKRKTGSKGKKGGTASIAKGTRATAKRDRATDPSNESTSKTEPDVKSRPSVEKRTGTTKKKTAQTKQNMTQRRKTHTENEPVSKEEEVRFEDTIPEDAITIDRRSGKDRRKESSDASESAGSEKPKLERRAKVTRRRQIDPTTCERDYTDDEIEFMNAIDEYKRTSGRMFPTCSEVLEVLRNLGYLKVKLPAEDAVDSSEEAPATPKTADQKEGDQEEDGAVPPPALSWDQHETVVTTNAPAEFAQ